MHDNIITLYDWIIFINLYPKKLKKVYYLIKSQIQIPENPLYNLTESEKRRHMYGNIITLYEWIIFTTFYSKKLNKVHYLVKSQIQISKNPLYNLTKSGKQRHMYGSIIFFV